MSVNDHSVHRWNVIEEKKFLEEIGSFSRQVGKEWTAQCLDGYIKALMFPSTDKGFNERQKEELMLEAIKKKELLNGRT